MFDDKSGRSVGASQQGTPEFDRKQVIKLAVELGPLIVFFLVNSQAHRFIDKPEQAIFYGTGAFMVATLIALAVSKIALGRIPIMPLVSGFFIIVFGGLTLWFHNEVFIKMKPTIVNLMFAGALFAGLLAGQSFLKIALGEMMRLSDEGWRKLTFRWANFFIALAILNEVVWRNFSTDTWVSFKVFGIMPLTFAFALSQVALMQKYAEKT